MSMSADIRSRGLAVRVAHIESVWLCLFRIILGKDEARVGNVPADGEFNPHRRRPQGFRPTL